MNFASGHVILARIILTVVNLPGSAFSGITYLDLSTSTPAQKYVMVLINEETHHNLMLVAP